VVVLAGWLEGNALVMPAHGPVDLPHKLAADVCAVRQAHGAFVSVAAGVPHRFGLVGGDAGIVAAADLAVRLEGEILATAFRDGALVPAGRLLLSERVEHEAPLLHGPPDRGVVEAGAIALGLSHLGHLDAQLTDRRQELAHVALRPGRVVPPWVRDIGQRHSHISLEGRIHASRHSPQSVVVVPRVQVHSLVPSRAQCFNHEMGGEHLAQVSHVDRA
jgi:hypothetical protein